MSGGYNNGPRYDRPLNNQGNVGSNHSNFQNGQQNGNYNGNEGLRPSGPRFSSRYTGCYECGDFTHKRMACPRLYNLGSENVRYNSDRLYYQQGPGQNQYSNLGNGSNDSYRHNLNDFRAAGM